MENQSAASGYRDDAYYRRAEAGIHHEKFKAWLKSIKPGTKESKLVHQALAERRIAINNELKRLRGLLAKYLEADNVLGSLNVRPLVHSKVETIAALDAHISKLAKADAAVPKTVAKASKPATAAQPSPLKELGRREQAGIAKGLVQEGFLRSVEVPALTKGMRVLKIGARVFFWVGAALLVYDGVNGSIKAVKEGDPLADLLASASPEFAAGSVRFAVAVTSGFAQGVFNGAAAPGQMLFEKIAPTVHNGLLNGAPEGSWAYRAVHDRIDRVVDAKLAAALRQGRDLYGPDYELPESYVQDVRMSAETEALAGAAL